MKFIDDNDAEFSQIIAVGEKTIDDTVRFLYRTDQDLTSVV